MGNSEKNKIHPNIKLTFDRDTKFFGPGTAGLLEEIERCGNVRDACANCGFSYSKGWTIIRRCEEAFGYPIVERRAGGQTGGSAVVTDEGRRLLAVYQQLRQELMDIAEDRFRELMDEYRLDNMETE